MKTFVSTYWSDLVMLSYSVPDDLIADHVAGLQIDRWDGSAYASVVGFHFGNTRVLGLSPALLLPAVANFAQWNLRTYVRHGEDRGIVFIKEFVPTPLVTQFVRHLYNENYHTAPLVRTVSVIDGRRTVRYDLDHGGRRHEIAVRASTSAPALPEPCSLDHFLVDRAWGWASGRPAVRFGVSHVPWRCYEVEQATASIDFALLYSFPERVSASNRSPLDSDERSTRRDSFPEGVCASARIPLDSYGRSARRDSFPVWVCASARLPLDSYGRSARRDSWSVLNDRLPDRVTWCDGSHVSVSWRQRTP